MPPDDSLPAAPPRQLPGPRPPEPRPLDSQHGLARLVEERTAELARAQAALAASAASQRESQSYFEKSFHSSPALMSIARATDGRIIEANPAFLRASGHARHEVIGHTTLELGLWLDLAQRDDFLRLIRTMGQVRDFEADFRSKSGETRWLLLTADLIELGGEPCMLAVGIDITDRRRRQQIEAAQREAQTYFEKSFHLSPALMAISRVSDHVITEVNPTFLRARGFTREEVIGRTAEDLRLWVNEAQREAFLRDIRERGAVRDLEAEFWSKKGEIATVLVNADVLELGGTPCVLSVGIDISDRRRRDRVQNATYAISQAVLAGGDLNALFAELHRIIGGLMPARNFYIALLSPDRSLLSFPYCVDEYSPPYPSRQPGAGLTEYVINTARPLRTTVDALTALMCDHRRYQPVGRMAALWLGAPLLIDGRAIGVVAVQDSHNANAFSEADLQLLSFFADQTAVAVQRRQAGEALARAEERYRSIFENALEGLYLTSPDGRFLSANPALARILGYSSVPELLRYANDVTHQLYVRPTRRDEFFALIQDSDEVSDFVSEIYRSDRTIIWISESVRVVRDARGMIDHFEGVAIDVTQQREAARVLREAKEASDAASRAKSYFLASVSHELRTPLNGILGYTQILRRDSALSAKQREGVRVINESADHLLALINDVLDLSKIEAGRIELHPVDFDLPAFTAAVEQVFLPRAREKGILFETVVGADLPGWVRGDEQRLRQIVFNLVSNAVKFTVAGGVVFTVSRAQGDAVRFCVSDTGPGIAAEDLGKLFEPFMQVGKTSGVSGTGLGLAISRSLVERMGGQLKVESKPGWGSRFWCDLSLPVTAASSVPLATADAWRLRGYEGPRRRILVVDDNAANRAVMFEMLAPLGFVLAEAETGEGALAETATFHPDLVLMDIRLPGAIDGLEATRRLRAKNEEPNLRVIAVSASAYDLDRDECFAAGCDGFLAKPVREEDLWTAVERALGLVWQVADTVDSATPFPLPLRAPPSVEAAALYDLAAKGDVVGIRARADALIALDAAYGPFAHRVLDLAGRFKMKAIRQFVAGYLPEPPKP